MTVSLSGCLRLNTSVSVRKDDTVSGRILVAGQSSTAMATLGRLRAPTGLENKVRVADYAANGFTGRELYFTQLTFAEMDSLILSFDQEDARPYTMSFRRAGSEVQFTGSLDLSGIPPDKHADTEARLDISFPAPITSTNGTLGSNNSVSWNPSAGQVTNLSAISEYPDPAARGFAVWNIVGIGMALLVCCGAIIAARHSRERFDRISEA